MADARNVIAAWLHAQYQKQHDGTTVENFHGDADALISALAAAGLKVVGREPTRAMLEACLDCNEDCDTDDFWRAMFDAAPPSPTQGEKK